MRHGLRIPSFALGPRTATLEEMGRYLRRAEDLGFDCAVSIDHLLRTPPAYACTWLEPIALLSALAGVTRTLRLGTMVLVLPLRNPVYFAKEWATLDLLSRGRTILGIGVGWHVGAALVGHAGDGPRRLGEGAAVRAGGGPRPGADRACVLELRLGPQEGREAGIGDPALLGVLGHGPGLLADALPARRGRRARGADQRADRGARRRRGHDRPEPARLGDGAARADRGRSPAARPGRRLIRYTGARVKRVEDPRLLRGRGQFLDDIVLPRMVSLAFVRSPHAHAAIRAVDANAASALDGVLRVVTAADVRAVARPLEPRLEGDGFTPTAWPVLADGRVNFCGEAVAAVVATNAYVVADACERVRVEYEPLPAIASIE